MPIYKDSNMNLTNSDSDFFFFLIGHGLIKESVSPRHGMAADVGSSELLL